MAVGGGVAPGVDVAPVEQGIVLAVGGNDLAQGLGQLHGFQHPFLRLDALAVVGEPGNIRGHGLHVGKGLPQFPTGDGPEGPDLNGRILLNNVQLDLQIFIGVGHRSQVGHGAYRRVTSGGSSGSPGFDRLLIRKSRLPKMYMNINETRDNKYGIGNTGCLALEEKLVPENKMPVLKEIHITQGLHHFP